MSSVDFRLYLITDRRQCRAGQLTEVLKDACKAGVRAVQIREKDLDSTDLFRLGSGVKEALKELEVRIFINDRADIARALGASGVHLTERSIPPDQARKNLTDGSLIGVSTHDIEGALRAQEHGADFVTFGPVFPTESKFKYGPPVGLKLLEETAKRLRIPIFALGGVRPERVAECLDVGAYGVACISAVIAAPDVAKAVGSFEEVLGGL